MYSNYPNWKGKLCLKWEVDGGSAGLAQKNFSLLRSCGRWPESRWESSLTLNKGSIEVEDGQEPLTKGYSGTAEKVRDPGLLELWGAILEGSVTWRTGFPEDILPLKFRPTGFNWCSPFTGSTGKMLMHVTHVDSSFKISFIEDKGKKREKNHSFLTSTPITLWPFCLF